MLRYYKMATIRAQLRDTDIITLYYLDNNRSSDTTEMRLIHRRIPETVVALRNVYITHTHTVVLENRNSVGRLNDPFRVFSVGTRIRAVLHA